MLSKNQFTPRHRSFKGINWHVTLTTRYFHKTVSSSRYLLDDLVVFPRHGAKFVFILTDSSRNQLLLIHLILCYSNRCFSSWKNVYCFPYWLTLMDQCPSYNVWTPGRPSYNGWTPGRPSYNVWTLISTGTFIYKENRSDKTRYHILGGCKIKCRHCWLVCSNQILRIVKGNFIWKLMLFF